MIVDTSGIKFNQNRILPYYKSIHMSSDDGLTDRTPTLLKVALAAIVTPFAFSLPRLYHGSSIAGKESFRLLVRKW